MADEDSAKVGCGIFIAVVIGLAIIVAWLNVLIERIELWWQNLWANFFQMLDAAKGDAVVYLQLLAIGLVLLAVLMVFIYLAYRVVPTFFRRTGLLFDLNREKKRLKYAPAMASFSSGDFGETPNIDQDLSWAYAILEIPPNVPFSKDDKRRFHKLAAQKFHPDKYANSNEATRKWAGDKMGEVNKAWKIIEEEDEDGEV